jgi:hypothetical protein
MIFLPKRWRQQPQVPVQLDRGNRLADGLVFYLMPSCMGVAGQLMRNPIASAEMTPDGLGSVGGGRDLTSASSAISSNAYTYYLRFKTKTVTASGLNQNIFSRNSTAGIGFDADHGNASYAGSCYHGGSFSVIGKPTGGALASETSYRIGCEYDGANANLYSNGARTVGPISHSVTTTGGTISVDDNGSNSFAQNRMSLVLFWARSIGADAMREIDINPWQIFAPIQRRIYVDIPAAAGFKSAWARNANTVIQRVL